jgi:hypothetical protein
MSIGNWEYGKAWTNGRGDKLSLDKFGKRQRACLFINTAEQPGLLRLIGYITDYKAVDAFMGNRQVPEKES